MITFHSYTCILSYLHVTVIYNHVIDILKIYIINTYILYQHYVNKVQS